MRVQWKMHNNSKRCEYRTKEKKQNNRSITADLKKGNLYVFF